MYGIYKKTITEFKTTFTPIFPPYLTMLFDLMKPIHINTIKKKKHIPFIILYIIYTFQKMNY